MVAVAEVSGAVVGNGLTQANRRHGRRCPANHLPRVLHWPRPGRFSVLDDENVVRVLIRVQVERHLRVGGDVADRRFGLSV
jgi:hypothetical protein